MLKLFDDLLAFIGYVVFSLFSVTFILLGFYFHPIITSLIITVFLMGWVGVSLQKPLDKLTEKLEHLVNRANELPLKTKTAQTLRNILFRK